MDLARDTGEPAMTPQLTLAQEGGIDIHRGFIIFMPLYRKNAPLQTNEQRRQALTGFISGVFRSKVFFDLLIKSILHATGPLKVELYDGVTPRPNELFYSFRSDHKNLPDPKNYSELGIQLANHRWLARIATTDVRPVGVTNKLHWLLLIIGLLISSLVFLVVKLIQLQNRELSKNIDWLTETKGLLQEAKESAEVANNMKGSFLANMSHEIRTPLSVIISSSKFLMDPSTPEMEKNNFIQMIYRNGNNLLSIINDILDLSKIEAGMVNLEFIKLPLRTLLNDFAADMQLLAQGKAITFKLEIDPEVPKLFGTDPTRLQQILRNIIGNAIKFTAAGSVEVKVEAAPEDCLRILVQDSGIGISAGQQLHLFQVFSQGDATFTRKFGGSGLGLVLSKKLAQLLGGDITLKKSETAKGSLFEVIIKNETSAKPANLFKLTGKSEKEHPLAGKNILLVEDSVDNQYVISRTLQRQGAQVEIAQNGEEGLEKALLGNFDLTLMDIQMPIMGGFTATKILREKGYTGLIFALTAHTQPHLKELSAKAGFNDFLSKPFLIDELLEKFKMANGESV